MVINTIFVVSVVNIIVVFFVVIHVVVEIEREIGAILDAWFSEAAREEGWGREEVAGVVLIIGWHNGRVAKGLVG